jgi:hypothetical protein
MTERATDQEPTLVPARADRRRRQPSAIDLVGTEGLYAILGDEAKSRSLSHENPLTGKPDAGDPPVRFGGRGGATAPSLPLSVMKLFTLPTKIDTAPPHL